jgi:hypothetical protein
MTKIAQLLLERFKYWIVARPVWRKVANALDFGLGVSGKR